MPIGNCCQYPAHAVIVVPDITQEDPILQLLGVREKLLKAIQGIEGEIEDLFEGSPSLFDEQDFSWDESIHWAWEGSNSDNPCWPNLTEYHKPDLSGKYTHQVSSDFSISACGQYMAFFDSDSVCTTLYRTDKYVGKDEIPGFLDYEEWHKFKEKA